jgi:hypothetical protein
MLDELGIFDIKGITTNTYPKSNQFDCNDFAKNQISASKVNNFYPNSVNFKIFTAAHKTT